MTLKTRSARAKQAIQDQAMAELQDLIAEVDQLMSGTGSLAGKEGANLREQINPVLHLPLQLGLRSPVRPPDFRVAGRRGGLRLRIFFLQRHSRSPWPGQIAYLRRTCAVVPVQGGSTTASHDGLPRPEEGAALHPGGRRRLPAALQQQAADRGLCAEGRGGPLSDLVGVRKGRESGQRINAAHEKAAHGRLFSLRRRQPGTRPMFRPESTVIR